NDVTWTNIAATNPADGNTKRLAVAAAYGSGTAGATTFSCGEVEHSRAITTILEISGSATSVAQAVRQSRAIRTFNSTDLEVGVSAVDTENPALSEFAASTNMTLVVAGQKGTSATLALDTGYTSLLSDSIDTQLKIVAGYLTSEDLTPKVAIVGTVTGAHTWMIALEINEVSGWTVVTELIGDASEDSASYVRELYIAMGDVWQPLSLGQTIVTPGT